MSYGTSGTGRDKAVRLFAQAAAISVAVGGEYFAQDMKMFGRYKMQRVVGVLKCRVCGKTNVTLYKSGDSRICRECKEIEEGFKK